MLILLILIGLLLHYLVNILCFAVILLAINVHKINVLIKLWTLEDSIATGMLMVHG